MSIIAPTIFTLIYASLCLLAFGLVYERWMHRESFFQANRMYLLLTPLLALVIPHLRIEVTLTSAVHPAVRILEQSQQIPSEWLRLLFPQPQAYVLSWGTVLLAIYLTGFSIVLLRSLLNYLKIWRWIRSGKMVNMGGWVLVEQADIPEAASFFNCIFWKNDQPIPTMVLQHELIHVQQGHSWDVLLMEIWIALHWFNPLVYRLRQRLQETHEFIADAGVIEAQGSKYAYACLLASQKQKLEQMPYNTFAAQLSSRLRRMTQTSSPQWKAIQYAICLPLVLSLGMFFSVNYLQALPMPASNGNLGETIKKLEETPVLQLRVQPLETAKKQATTTNFAAVELIPTLAPDTVPVQSTIKVTSGNATVKVVTDGQTLTLGGPGMISTSAGKPLIIIDGKNMGLDGDENPMAKLNPDDIKAINVLKGESAIATYGEAAKDGVIVVTTKGNPQSIENSINQNFNININGEPQKVETVNVTTEGSVKIRTSGSSSDRPLIVKDGKVLGRLHRGESGEPLKSIEPNTIKSLNVIKGKAAIDKYGKDAEDGVIEVETKKQ